MTITARDRLGQKLKILCQNADNEILLVAPFIKVSVLRELLILIDHDVKFQCVTRWLPDEILAGVSDLEVWSVVRSSPNSSLWLRSDLHAKYYRADDRCLIGSANLTAKALGWSSNNNLELLVELPANVPTLQDFERDLFARAIQVDDDLFEQYQNLINQLQQENLPVSISESSQNTDPSTQPTISVEDWLPSLRNPEELYLAYSGEWDRLTTAARLAAQNDLNVLPVIPNLSKTAFKAYIGLLLLQMPLIQRIDTFVRTPQRFGAVRDLLDSLPRADRPDRDSRRDWQTLMRWLLYFLPDRYAVSIPGHSEIFYRISGN